MTSDHSPAFVHSEDRPAGCCCSRTGGAALCSLTEEVANVVNNPRRCAAPSPKRGTRPPLGTTLGNRGKVANFGRPIRGTSAGGERPESGHSSPGGTGHLFRTSPPGEVRNCEEKRRAKEDDLEISGGGDYYPTQFRAAAVKYAMRERY